MQGLIQKYLQPDTIIYGHPFNILLKIKQKYQIENDAIFFYHRQTSKNKIGKMLESFSKKNHFQSSSQEENLYDRLQRNDQENYYYQDQEEYKHQNHSGDQEAYQDQMYVLQEEFDQNILEKENYPIINKSWNDLNNISPDQHLKPFKKANQNDIKSSSIDRKFNYLPKQQKDKQNANNMSLSQQQDQDWQTQEEEQLQDQKQQNNKNIIKITAEQLRNSG